MHHHLRNCDITLYSHDLMQLCNVQSAWHSWAKARPRSPGKTRMTLWWCVCNALIYIIAIMNCMLYITICFSIERYLSVEWNTLVGESSARCLGTGRSSCHVMTVTYQWWPLQQCPWKWRIGDLLYFIRMVQSFRIVNFQWRGTGSLGQLATTCLPSRSRHTKLNLV